MIVVAFGNDVAVKRSIRSVLQDAVESVIVVNHADEVPDVVIDPRVRVATESNLGFGAGVNLGLHLTSSEYVLLLNPDAEMCASLRLGLDYLDAHPNVGAVQGVVLNTRTGKPERSAGSDLRWFHLVARLVHLRRLQSLPLVELLGRRIPALRDHFERVPAEPTSVEALAATAPLVRRRALDDIGGFDTTFFLYGEDLDVCRRLRLSGWELVTLPTVWTSHVSGGTAKTPRHRELEWWAGTMRYAAKWWTAPAFAVALAAATLRAIAFAVTRPSRLGTSWTRIVREPTVLWLRRALLKRRSRN